MEVRVDALHVGKGNFLPKDHLIESADEERIEETPMEDCKSHNSSNEFEVVKMFWVDSRMGVDLKSVIIVGGVFEKAVERIKHFVR